MSLRLVDLVDRTPARIALLCVALGATVLFAPWAVFGTFVVRSGLIQSVHSFALSDIGPYFLGYLVAVTLLAVGLMIWRLPMLQSENTFDSMVSRESSFLLNNLVFAGIAFATFWGTIYPLVSDTLRGQEMTVGPQFYNQVNGPLFLILLVLMGVEHLAEIVAAL